MSTLYKFKTPDIHEENDRFLFVEDRGDRVLVADASPIWNDCIRPAFVYLKSDLEPVQ